MIRASGSVNERCARPGTTAAASAASPASMTCARVLIPFGCALLSLCAGLRGVLGLQGRFRLTDRGQPALPAGQLGRQLITATVRPIRGILNRIQPLSVGEQRLNLGGQLGLGSHHPVVAHRPMPARRRPHLRPIQSDRPNDTNPACAHKLNDWVNSAFSAAPCRVRNRLIATKSGAACAVRNRKAMSSWQRRSNAREEVTPWE